MNKVTNNAPEPEEAPTTYTDAEPDTTTQEDSDD